MKTSTRLIISILIIVLFLFINCEKDDEDEEKGYSFEVIAYKGNFEGYYKVDDNPAVFFTGTAATENTNYYSFVQKIDPESSVYISSTAVDTSATSMQIHLYNDSLLVETESFSQTTDVYGSESIVNGTLQYTISSSSSKSPSRNARSAASEQHPLKGKPPKDRDPLFSGFATDYGNKPPIPQDLHMGYEPQPD